MRTVDMRYDHFGLLSSYAHCLANYSKNVNISVELDKALEKPGYEKVQRAIARCENTGIPLACDSGHRGSLPISCHRPMCPRCGEKGSRAHKRKTARIAKRLQWVGQSGSYALGYVVLTIPKRLRYLAKRKDVLSGLHRLAARCVSDVFSADGSATVIHFYGDDWYSVQAIAKRYDVTVSEVWQWIRAGKLESRSKEKGQTVVRNPSWLEYHPHVNILFPIKGGGYQTDEKLRQLKRKWREMLSDFLGETIQENEENAYYGFATCEKKVMHKISYVAQSTIKAERFLNLSSSVQKFFIKDLRGWRNVRYHGRLSDRNWRKYLEELGVVIAKKESLKCPVCKHQGCDHDMMLMKISHTLKTKTGKVILGNRIILDELGYSAITGWKFLKHESCEFLLSRSTYIELRQLEGASSKEIQKELEVNDKRAYND